MLRLNIVMARFMWTATLPRVMRRRWEICLMESPDADAAFGLGGRFLASCYAGWISAYLYLT